MYGKIRTRIEANRRDYYNNTRNVIIFITRELGRDLFYLWCNQTQNKDTQSKRLDGVMLDLFHGELLQASIECDGKHVGNSRSERCYPSGSFGRLNGR